MELLKFQVKSFIVLIKKINIFAIPHGSVIDFCKYLR